MKSQYYFAARENMRKSAEYRDGLKAKVKKAMEQNPGISLRSLASMIGVAYPTVSTAYHQFRRGEL